MAFIDIAIKNLHEISLQLESNQTKDKIFVSVLAIVGKQKWML